MIPSRCIAFPNASGHLLRGILHEPDDARARGVCVLLLSPGIKGRVGPHRLYLKIAARLVPLGFHVLRFDFPGLGDSDGALSERVMADMYNSIQSGRYVGDTTAAMDWMENTCRVRRFVGSGLCGGSLTALLTAENDRRIECLLGIGLPATMEGSREHWGRHLTEGQLARVRDGYFRRLRSPESWRRLLLGRSDYAVIWKAIRQVLVPAGSRAPAPAAADDRTDDNTNPRFGPAFRAVAESGRPLLLLFGENDRLHFAFAEKFEARNAPWLQHRPRPYSVQLISKANHVMSDNPWVKEMLDIAERWLQDQYPA